MSNLNKIDNKEFQRLKYVVEQIAKSNWRMTNIKDNQCQWTGGDITECELGKAYPIKTTKEIIERFLNDYK